MDQIWDRVELMTTKKDKGEAQELKGKSIEVSFRRQDRRVFRKESHCKDFSGGPAAKTLCS